MKEDRQFSGAMMQEEQSSSDFKLEYVKHCERCYLQTHTFNPVSYFYFNLGKITCMQNEIRFAKCLLL